MIRRVKAQSRVVYFNFYVPTQMSSCDAMEWFYLLFPDE